MASTDLAKEFEARLTVLGALANRLQEKTVEALEDVQHIDRIKFRAKDISSFVTKATQLNEDGSAKYRSPLAEVEDQVAGRVLTFFLSDIPIVKASVTEWFGAVEHQTKEPDRSDAFGYMSDHYIFVIADHFKPAGWDELRDMPTTFELQIRTLFMHAWAEPQHLIDYKGADLDRETEKELAWAAASAWGADRILDEIAIRTGQASQ